MPPSTSSSASSESAASGATGADGGGAAVPQNTSSTGLGAALLTVENLTTHGASSVAPTPSASTATSTSTTYRFFRGLRQDDLNLRLDELRLDPEAGFARLEADTRAARQRARGGLRGSTGFASPGWSDPSSSSDSSGPDTPPESSGTPSGSVGTPSESSDEDSTITTTTEATEPGDTIGQKLARYLRGEIDGREVRNLVGWQELCLACGAAVGTNPFVCGEAIKKMNFNIFDMIEALGTGTVARGFENLGALADYSSKSLKIMGKSEAKTKPMLRVFLRDFNWALNKIEREQGDY